ncbi:MAG TPA: hypothetical protein VGP47_06470 [Parachlamydiaceae bacterium]|nr:hypothetical protein [Parachlamydiaceae bacterium]
MNTNYRDRDESSLDYDYKDNCELIVSLIDQCQSTIYNCQSLKMKKSSSIFCMDLKIQNNEVLNLTKKIKEIAEKIKRIEQSDQHTFTAKLDPAELRYFIKMRDIYYNVREESIEDMILDDLQAKITAVKLEAALLKENDSDDGIDEVDDLTKQYGCIIQ